MDLIVQVLNRLCLTQLMAVSTRRWGVHFRGLILDIWICLDLSQLFWISSIIVFLICLRFWILRWMFGTWFWILILEILIPDENFWFSERLWSDRVCDVSLSWRWLCRKNIDWLDILRWFGFYELTIPRAFGGTQYRFRSREGIDCACNGYWRDNGCRYYGVPVILGCPVAGYWNVTICMIKCRAPNIHCFISTLLLNIALYSTL